MCYFLFILVVEVGSFSQHQQLKFLSLKKKKTCNASDGEEDEKPCKCHWLIEKNLAMRPRKQSKRVRKKKKEKKNNDAELINGNFRINNKRILN